MEPLFNMLTDEQVKSFSTELSAISKIEDKIHFVRSKTGNDGIGEEFERTIDEQVYKYGIPFNWETKRALSKYFFETDRYTWYNGLQSNFSTRIASCENETQQQKLIKEEIQFLTEGIERCKKSYERLKELIPNLKVLAPSPSPTIEEEIRIANDAAVYQGYLAEARKTFPLCETFEEVRHPRTGSFTTGNGAAVYLMKEEFLPSLISNRDIDADSDPINVAGTLYPEQDAHKLLLLDRLGVIDFFLKNFPSSETIMQKWGGW